MKKILLLLTVLVLTNFVKAQTYGNQIQAKNNPGVIGTIQRTGDGLKVADSAVLGKLNSGVAISGTYTYTRGTPTTMTVTSLNSLTSSSTVGWQSARVDNTSTLAGDYLISIKITMPNSAPANDKAAYVFVVPWYYDGSAWFANSGGTATLPSGTEGGYTIASPHNLLLGTVLNFTTANMIMQGTFLLSTVFGGNMPDGFSFVVINFGGQTIHSSGNVVQYTSIKRKL